MFFQDIYRGKNLPCPCTSLFPKGCYPCISLQDAPCTWNNFAWHARAWGRGGVRLFFPRVNLPLVTFEHWINVKEGGWSIKDKMHSHICGIRAWGKRKEEDSNFYDGKERQNSVLFVYGAAAMRQLTQTSGLVSINTAWAHSLFHHLQKDRERFELSRIRTKKKSRICF